MRLLVVEDEAKVASFIKRGFEEESYAVDVAVDGEEAVSMVDVYDYDMVTPGYYAAEAGRAFGPLPTSEKRKRAFR